MKSLRARVTVLYKSGVLDPQGQAIKNSLASLGFPEVLSVRAGKLFEIELAERDRGKADAMVREMCKKLLANPVIEDFLYEIVAD
ncbi:MAG: phosphoribosylformylglycinamidine synthase subunit PurS [Vicinamibacteria bacterium]